jgi:hypothetical protein
LTSTGANGHAGRNGGSNGRTVGEEFAAIFADEPEVLDEAVQADLDASLGAWS